MFIRSSVIVIRSVIRQVTNNNLGFVVGDKGIFTPYKSGVTDRKHLSTHPLRCFQNPKSARAIGCTPAGAVVATIRKGDRLTAPQHRHTRPATAPPLCRHRHRHHTRTHSTPPPYPHPPPPPRHKGDQLTIRTRHHSHHPHTTTI